MKELGNTLTKFAKWWGLLEEGLLHVRHENVLKRFDVSRWKVQKNLYAAYISEVGTIILHLSTIHDEML